MLIHGLVQQLQHLLLVDSLTLIDDLRHLKWYEQIKIYIKQSVD